MRTPSPLIETKIRSFDRGEGTRVQKKRTIPGITAQFKAALIKDSQFSNWLLRAECLWRFFFAPLSSQWNLCYELLFALAV